MTVPRRILVVHADARARRRLLLVLVEAGYDVRAFAAAEPAMAAAREEWFDLALIDYALPGGQGFGFTRVLRQAQATVPIIMLLPSLELPLIIEGIRLGLTDVLQAEEDPCAIVRRVHALLRPSAPTNPSEELTPADLAQVEDMLARLEAAQAAGGGRESTGETIAALREELKAAMRERTALEARLERAVNEKEALAAELQTLLTQNVDSSRLQAELAQLQTQREMTAAAQVAIEIKARQLAETRALVEAERAALEEAKRAETPPAAADASSQISEAERIHLAAVKEDLKTEENRLRAEATRLRQESMQLSRERRRWHEELDELREREENLRAYEERLREMQAELESQRLRQGSGAVDASGAVSAREAALQAELDALRKEKARAEAETAVARDERMTLQELERMIRQREERLRELDEQISAYEGLQRSLSTADAAPAARTGMLKSLTRWGKSGS